MRAPVPALGQTGTGHELADFLAMSSRTGIEVRFIELMPIQRHPGLHPQRVPGAQAHRFHHRPGLAGFGAGVSVRARARASWRTELEGETGEAVTKRLPSLAMHPERAA